MQGSTLTAIERVARVIVAQRLSINAQGADASAGDAVDMEWESHIGDAWAILRALREPDEVMAAAGDIAVWSRMIDAALTMPVGE